MGQPYEYISVDLKPMAKKAAARAALNDLDPLVVDPQHYSLELENEYVKVIRCRIPPHDSVKMHHHTSNSVMVFPRDQQLRQTAADGTIRDLYPKAGQALWTEPATHKGENLSDQPFEYLRVDIKAAVQ